MLSSRQLPPLLLLTFLSACSARGLTPVPQQEWQELAQAAAARRPLLRIVC